MPENSSPFECPECASHAAQIIASNPPQAKCKDCGHTYPIPTIPPEAKPEPKKARKASPGTRHRRDNGPQELEVTAVPPLTRAELGEATTNIQELQAGGPQALIAAHREAQRLGQRFGEQMEEKWFLKTKWLSELEARHRARARYAMHWRPRFLAILAITRSVMQACRGAKIHFDTYQLHRDKDPDFAEQICAAEAHAVALLHDQAWSLAVEGSCEPVFWQGIKVGHVRKFDSKLIIEMLRAHIPDRFKAPGQANVQINAGNGSQLLVIGPAEHAELCANRKASLLRLAEAEKD